MVGAVIVGCVYPSVYVPHWSLARLIDVETFRCLACFGTAAAGRLSTIALEFPASAVIAAQHLTPTLAFATTDRVWRQRPHCCG